MPSLIVSAQSGGMPIISGNPWSGKAITPQGQIILRAARTNSGSIYIGLSGGLTVLSGSYPLSGVGMLDGMELPPGGEYRVPRLAFSNAGPTVSGFYGVSGGFGIYASCELAASGGFARLFWEAY